MSALETPAAKPPAARDARAFAWRQQVYAFGGTWFTFRRTDRRTAREVLDSVGATHAVRLAGADAAHLGAFRLPGERGRILCAVEAARIHFGDDFAGVFELAAPSLPKGWWVVAVVEDAVLLDVVCADLDSARAAWRGLFVPGREFSTRVAPPGFAGETGPPVPLDEFLDLADRPLGRRSPRGLPVAAGLAGLCLLAGALLLARGGAGVASTESATPPALPDITDPLAFARQCERQVAAALLAPATGRALVAAACDGGAARLVLAGTATSPGTTTVDIPLALPRRQLSAAELASGHAGLAERLTAFGPAPVLELVHAASETAPWDSYRFQLPLQRSLPALLHALADLPNVEWTELRFTPRTLNWHVVGEIHVDR